MLYSWPGLDLASPHACAEGWPRPRHQHIAPTDTCIGPICLMSHATPRASLLGVNSAVCTYLSFVPAASADHGLIKTVFPLSYTPLRALHIPPSSSTPSPPFLNKESFQRSSKHQHHAGGAQGLRWRRRRRRRWRRGESSPMEVGGGSGDRRGFFAAAAARAKRRGHRRCRCFGSPSTGASGTGGSTNGGGFGELSAERRHDNLARGALGAKRRAAGRRRRRRRRLRRWRGRWPGG